MNITKILTKKTALVSVFIIAVALFVLSISTSSFGFPVAQSQVDDVSDINQGYPQVFVDDLKVDASEYQSGSTVSGSFDLISRDDVNYSDLYYEISLMSDYRLDGLAQNFYAMERRGPIYIAAGETETIDFTMDLPDGISGQGFGINVTLTLKTGEQMGWQDAIFDIVGGDGVWIAVQSAVLEYDGGFHGNNMGITVAEDSDLALVINAKNMAASASLVNYKLEISNRQDLDKTVFEQNSDSAVEFASAVSTDVKIILPTNLMAGVYVGSVYFYDDQGVRSAPVPFQYILGGDLATISSISSDQGYVRSGNTVDVRVIYQGAPVNALTGEVADLGEGQIQIDLFNSETDEFIGTASADVSLNDTINIVIPVEAMASARSLDARVTIIDESGVVKAMAEASLSESPVGLYELYKVEIVSTIVLLIILIIVIFLVAGVVKGKRSRESVVLPVLLCVLVASAVLGTNALSAYTYKNGSFFFEGADSYVNSTFASGHAANSGSFVPNVYVNTPAYPVTYDEEEDFYITGTAQAWGCNNNYQNIYVEFGSDPTTESNNLSKGQTINVTQDMIGDIIVQDGNSYDPYEDKYDFSAGYWKINFSWDEYTPGTGIWWTKSRAFSSLDATEENYPFYAENEEGEHRIYVYARNDFGQIDGTNYGSRWGYIKYNVDCGAGGCGSGDSLACVGDDCGDEEPPHDPATDEEGMCNPFYDEQTVMSWPENNQVLCSQGVFDVESYSGYGNERTWDCVGTNVTDSCRSTYNPPVPPPIGPEVSDANIEPAIVEEGEQCTIHWTVIDPDSGGVCQLHNEQNVGSSIIQYSLSVDGAEYSFDVDPKNSYRITCIDINDAFLTDTSDRLTCVENPLPVEN